MGTEKHGPRQRRHRHLFMFRTGGETGSWWQLEERGVPGNCLRKTSLSFLGLFGRVGAQPALGAECVAVCWVGWGLSTCVSLCLRCLQRKCEPVKTGGRVSL